MAEADLNEIIMASAMKWVLVEWADHTFDVVNVKAVKRDVKPHELTAGKVIAVLKKNGVRRSAKVVMTSDDRQFLNQEKVYMAKIGKQVVGPSKVSQPPTNNTRNGHSVSWNADSWSTGHSSKEPTTSESSTSPEEVIAQTKCVDMGTSTDIITTYDQKTQTDCTTEITECNARLRVAVQAAQRAYLVSIVDNYGPSIMNDMDINNDSELDIMFTVVNKRVNKIKEYSPPIPRINNYPTNGLKEESNSQEAKKTNNRKRKLNSAQNSGSNCNISSLGTKGLKKYTNTISEGCSSKQAKSASTHRNNIPYCEPSTSKGRRSATKRTPMKLIIARRSTSASPDSINIMVPLGSGHTLINQSTYEQVKWNSHTIATRQLLSAVFPRSVLATHSLTGKRSPAFQHLPPKSCLDQRKVTDIVMTVTKMCKVKENLVRAAITVKCADESKMMKLKEKKETGSNSLNSSSETNSENLNQSWDSDQENKPMN